MSSTIERLRTAHHLALRAQHSADMNAASLIRTWPLVAAAAHAAFWTLPEVSRPGNLLVERISLDARSLGESLKRQIWPGPGKLDSALLQVVSAFENASNRSAMALSPAESTEATRIIASSLWTTSQLIGRATRDFAFDIRIDRDKLDDTRSQVSVLATDTRRRFNAVEQLAAGALNGRPNTALGSVAGQLTQAVATWDIEAHRALLINRSTAVLHVLAHQEAASVKALELFVDQADASGILDLTTAGRLRPILTDSAESWNQVCDIAAELSFGQTAVPMTLIDAATGLREAFQEAAKCSDAKNQSEILSAFSSHLASAVTVSAACRDLIADGELRAPARALARVAAERLPDLVESQVDPVAIHRGLSVPLTKDARNLLEGAVARAFIDADEAVNRSAGLDGFRETGLPDRSTSEWSQSNDAPARHSVSSPVVAPLR